MIPIAPMEKFSSKNFITCIEISGMTSHSGKSNELRNANTVRGRTGERGTASFPFKKGKIYYDKTKVIELIINLR